MPFRTRVLGGISIYTDNCFPKQLFSPELYIARTINFSKMNIGKFTSLYDLLEAFPTDIIRKSKFPQNPKRSVRFSGKRTKRSVQKRKARNTQKAETKVL